MAGDHEEEERLGDHAKIKSTSPYFLSTSDNPGQVYVGELLRDGNYGDWVNDMSNVLFAKNKIGFVDGTIETPKPESGNLMNWKRCNAMVKGWLTSAMEKEIRNSVRYAITAREIWIDLQERFGTESAPRAYELRRTIAMTRQEGMSVSTYYTKLRSIWDEIHSITPIPKCDCNGCACDVSKQVVAIRDKERLYEFLMGLNDEYATIKTHILSTRPTPTLGAAYHLVAQDEQQRSVSMDQRRATESAAFQVTSKRGDKNMERKNDKEKGRRCTKCHKTGHTIDNCFEIIGYPEWWRGEKEQGHKSRPRAATVSTNSSPIAGLTGAQYARLVQIIGETTGDGQATQPPVANMSGKIKLTDAWVIDSGASEHITYDETILRQKNNNMTLPVKIPNGSFVAVKNVGSTNLSNGLQIKGVLNVPEFKCNLLSVSRLTRDLNCSITFYPNTCVMQDLRSRNLIGLGRARDGLYYLEPLERESVAFSVSTKPKMWHRRLGHASDTTLRKIKDLDSFSIHKFFCDSCVRAKQTKLPFSDSFIKTKRCFELIHCDIWGCYKTASFSGDRYFLSIVDDYSRAVWVYLMRAKSEVSHFFTMFCNMASTQFGEKVKRIRTDNGMEFQSNYMLSFYKEHGILLETSCTYTPEQNGVVERKHRHILEIARALRFEASLPIDFWGECVMTSVYIINRLPSQVIGNKSPHEILLGRSPTYSHLRVFGCLTYAHDNHCKYDKFGERGRPCIFVGYPMGQKGYKVYDLQNQKLYVTRNAIFFEDIFPFANNFEDLNLNGEKDLDVALRRIKSNIPTWREPGQTMRHDDDDDDASSHAVHDITPATETGQHENPYENPEVGQHDLQITDAAQAAEPCTHEQSATRQTEQTRAPNVHPADIPRKSDRIKMKPKRLEGFETNLPHSIDYPSHTPMPDPGTSTVYPLSHFVSYDKFSQSHKVFLAAITSRDEPKHFAQAVKDPLWCDAMKREIQALEQNGTWSLVSLPPGKKVVDSKWVYKIKYKPNGEIERHKARLVAKGYTQIEGIDFHETFAPVAKLVTVRCMLAVAAKKRWEVHQLDVNNAFLHGDLKEDIYMRVPQGFSKAGDTRVCKLQKSLYGLRQASRNWYKKFTASLITLGFRQSRADHSLFVFQRGTTYVSALIYVDDVLLAGNDKQRIQDVKTHLDSQFSIKDLGPLKYFLGIEVARSAEGFVLSQRKYTLDILEECGLQGSRPTNFPMEQNLKLRKDDTSPAVDAARYRRLVGRLLYLTVTRPDIVYSVNQLSQFLSNPRQSHMDATMRVLRYLKMTPGQGIFLPTKGELTLNAYSDADWGGCAFSRRSSTGYFISLGGSPISWRTKKQTVVSRSSAEAEYRAMATTVSEVLWLRWLLKDFLASQTGPTSLFCDNQAARQIANNPVFHERTKHVEMDCYFVRERVESGEITPCCISTNLQVADIFTKALGSERFRFLRDKLGVRDLHTPS